MSAYNNYSYSNMKEHCIGPIYGFIARDYMSTCLLLVVALHSCGEYIVNIFFPELFRFLTNSL